MRTLFRVIWPIRVVNKGRAGNFLELDSQKFVKMYPFLKGANYQLTEKSVNSTKKKKVKKSRREQAILYRKLLKSGKAKSRAELARRFGVSRAWVTKVLS